MMDLHSVLLLVCGVVIPGKQLPSPREAVADPLPKHLLLLVEFSSVTVTKSLKETVADPLVQSTLQYGMAWADICVVDKVMYMGSCSQQ